MYFIDYELIIFSLMGTKQPEKINNHLNRIKNGLLGWIRKLR